MKITVDQARQNSENYKNEIIQKFKTNEIPKLYKRIEQESFKGNNKIIVSPHYGIDYQKLVNILKKEFEGYFISQGLSCKDCPIEISW